MNDSPINSQPAAADSVSGDIQLAPGVFVRPGDLRIQYSRSGGPGGQNVNKINSKAEIWVRLDAIIGLTHGALERLKKLAGSRITKQNEIHLRSETQRSQESNRQEALERLRQMIIAARIEPKVRRKIKPSKSAKRKRLDSKRKRGEIKSNRRGKIDEW